MLPRTRSLQTFDENWAMYVNSWTPERPWLWVETDLAKSVWWVWKVVNDLSLFHWIWTFNIPQSSWNIEENWTRLSNNDDSTKVLSVNWSARMTSWPNIWDNSRLVSRRSPRYQPNRGHYYATAWFLPNKNWIWKRCWGLASKENWAYFQLEDWVLYAVILNDSVEVRKEEITLPDWFDLEKGNLYDIDFQWRWVWDYYFLLNLKLVHTITFLWTWDNVSISNPAIPACYTVENTDWTDLEITFGCVDITSEWGKLEWNTYISCSNELTISDPQWRSISWYNQPLLIIRLKDVLYWKENTRNAILSRISISSDQKSIWKLFFTKDVTAFWGNEFLDTNFQTAFPWSWIEYLDCVWYDNNDITFDTSKANKLYLWRVQIDNTLMVDNPSERSELYLEGWDYLVLTGEREWGWNTKMFWSAEFWEEF